MEFVLGVLAALAAYGFASLRVLNRYERVSAQDVITRDNISVKVNAVLGPPSADPAEALPRIRTDAKKSAPEER